MKVLIFESTRAVIKAERAVRGAELYCRIIPVPRSVSPQCGMALEVYDDAGETISRLLLDIEINIKVFDRSEVKL